MVFLTTYGWSLVMDAISFSGRLSEDSELSWMRMRNWRMIR